MKFPSSIVGISVIVALIYLVYAKAIKNNPSLADKMRSFMPHNLFGKKEEVKKKVTDTVEQTYDEKRSML